VEENLLRADLVDKTVCIVVRLISVFAGEQVALQSEIDGLWRQEPENDNCFIRVKADACTVSIPGRAKSVFGCRVNVLLGPERENGHHIGRGGIVEIAGPHHVKEFRTVLDPPHLEIALGDFKAVFLQFSR